MKKTRLIVGMLIIAVISGLAITTLMLTMSKPEKTLDNFVTSMKNYDFENAKTYYADSIEEDKKIANEVVSKNEFKDLKEYAELENEFKKLMSQLNYKVLSKEVSKETNEATLNVEMNYVDVSEPMINAVEGIFEEMFENMFSGKEYTEEEVEVMTVVKTTENLKNYENKISKATGKINFIKENKEWKISSIDENILKALAFGVFQEDEDQDQEKSKKEEKK